MIVIHYRCFFKDLLKTLKKTNKQNVKNYSCEEEI